MFDAEGIFILLYLLTQLALFLCFTRHMELGRPRASPTLPSLSFVAGGRILAVRVWRGVRLTTLAIE